MFNHWRKKWDVKAMKISIVNLAKIYLVGVGLLSSYYLYTVVFGLIVSPLNPVLAEPSFSSIHILLSTFYISFPMVAVLANNYKLYVAMLGIAASRIVLAMSGSSVGKSVLLPYQ